MAQGRPGEARKDHKRPRRGQERHRRGPGEAQEGPRRNPGPREPQEAQKRTQEVHDAEARSTPFPNPKDKPAWIERMGRTQRASKILTAKSPEIQNRTGIRTQRSVF